MRIQLQRLLPVLAAALMLATAAGAASAEPQPNHRQLFDTGEKSIKSRLYDSATNAILRAAEAADIEGDYGSAYWYLWQLARVKDGPWDLAQRVAWFERTEVYINKRDRKAKVWRQIDLPNYIQLLCEKDTVLNDQGRAGLAFVAVSRAEDLMTEYYGKAYDNNSFKTAPQLRGVYVSLLLDRANHLEYSGRLLECEGVFKQCLEFLAVYTNRPGWKQETRRAHNNYGVLLSLMGRDCESNDQYAKAVDSGDESDTGTALSEANILRNEADDCSPSKELAEELGEKAGRLRAAGRLVDAVRIQRRVAAVLARAGLIEEAMAEFDAVISEASAKGYREVLADAFFWRGKARLDAGLPGAEGDLIDALAYYRRAARKPSEFRIYRAYAGLLCKEGRIEEGLVIWNEALRLNKFMQLKWLEPELLVIGTRLLVKANRVPDAKALWAEILGLLEEIPDLEEARRLRVLVARLHFLAAYGNEEQLALLKSEVARFVDNSRLSDYQKTCFTTFEQDRSDTYAPIPGTALPAIDLQPVFVGTRAVTSQSARAWLWLMNPAPAARKGRLSVEGKGTISCELAGTNRIGFTLEGCSTNGGTTCSTEITLRGDSVLAIELEDKRLLADQPVATSIIWSGDSTASSTWSVVRSPYDIGVKANISGTLSLRNPFFSVPVYHEVPAIGPGAGEPVNVRFVSSARCRVEIYQGESGELLAIDAAGDGSFGEQGDVLCVDADRNGVPEALPGGTCVAAYVFPEPDTEYGSALDLVFEVMVDGHWVPCGSDRLLLGSAPPATEP